jgi:hypothetical protein
LGVLAVAILTALAISASGCSLLFVNGPPQNHRTSSFFGCTSSNTIPIVDTAFAVGAVLGAASVGSDGYSTSGTRTTGAITYGAAAALLAGSAVYGFSKTSACREAQAELVARLPPPSAVPVLAAPVPYDPWVAHPAPPPSDLPEPTVTPTSSAPPPAAGASPWEAPSPAR